MIKPQHAQRNEKLFKMFPALRMFGRIFNARVGRKFIVIKFALTRTYRTSMSAVYSCIITYICAHVYIYIYICVCVLYIHVHTEWVTFTLAAFSGGKLCTK